MTTGMTDIERRLLKGGKSGARCSASGGAGSPDERLAVRLAEASYHLGPFEERAVSPRWTGRDHISQVRRQYAGAPGVSASGSRIATPSNDQGPLNAKPPDTGGRHRGGKDTAGRRCRSFCHCQVLLATDVRFSGEATSRCRPTSPL